MKISLIIVMGLVLLAAALGAVISCSSSVDQITPSTSLGTEPGTPDNPKGGNNRTDAWYDAGEDHNECMAVLVDSLAKYFPPPPPVPWYTTSACSAWAVNVVGVYEVSGLGYSQNMVNGLKDVMADNPVPETVSEWRTAVADIWDTQREKDYLWRLGDIMYAYTLTNAQMTDSLDDFKSDVNGVSWYSSEDAITPIMSVAWHSWDFSANGGFDPVDENYSNWFDWKEMLMGDVGGAITGWKYGGGTLQATAAGAAIYSGVDAAVQIYNHF